MFLRLLLLTLTLLVPSQELVASLARVAVVIDSEGLRVHGALEGVKSGLEKADRDFNVFYQLIDVSHDSNFRKHTKHLALKGFDIMIGVGPRANDLLCKLGADFPQIRVSLIEGQCGSEAQVNSVDFDGVEMAAAIEQFILLSEESERTKFAWVEEQADPQMLAIKDKLIQRLSIKRPELVIESWQVDPDRQIPLSSRLQSNRYAGVVLLASPSIEKSWIKNWNGGIPLLVWGSGDDAAIRLRKDSIRSSIKKLKELRLESLMLSKLFMVLRMAGSNLSFQETQAF